MTELQIEIIGYLAMILTIIGFTRNSIKVIRLFSSISCLFWILYGIFIESPSIIIMNFIIIFLHCYKQDQDYKKELRERDRKNRWKQYRNQ